MARPRNAATDAAILDATRAALVELGWSGLSMADVASRAGVAKTTLYRRWPGKSELVVDAVATVFDSLELPDLGNLRDDLEGVVLSFGALLERPETSAALLAVVGEAATDPALQQRLRATVVDRQKHLVVTGRARAQARGELPPDAADTAETARVVDLLFDVIAGAVVHRCLISGGSVDRQWAARFAALLLGGLAAMEATAQPNGE
ncbi:TetR/AcrR family transcriptional regulator [Streptomyces sp. 549]|uniref:TetR/AcrR family transcriptional regulator n=1 Tax=Streptomyces sp. 549 TaxID=3049076 RepID=UPI0024C238CA|nr:TetR/AcrR family transcriptional regulator [Streptomyces sp. 549]MDK1474895.1 TetR/AcrR family transcriptional regulator [Streptomyces sp. 549]